MSFRPNTIITITQLPNDVYPSGRDKTYVFDFVSSGEITSSWQNLTDTAKLRMPRNIYIEDNEGKIFNLGSSITGRPGANLYGDTTTQPVFMRGDQITIELGYFYDNMNGTPETLVMETVFNGFISKIKNRAPIEIECEDNMWKLKLLKAPNKLFKASEYTVQKMLTELLIGTGYTVVDGVQGSIQTNVGDFRTQNETVAQILERLRRDGGIYSYFRGNELRCSGIVYYPQDRNEEIFNFQDQTQPGEGLIHSPDQLEYTRKEDLNIAVKAHSEFITAGTGFNKDGTDKTKRKRLEVMVTKNGVLNKEAERSFQGDIINIPVLGATSLAYLTKKAQEYLPKFYYTGFKGAFTTFGQPMMRHGDAAILVDKIQTERSGTYLIKQVSTSFGMGGFKQKILLHLRIDKGYTVEQINAGL